MITNEDDLLHFVECLPADALKECTQSGSNDDAIAYWAESTPLEICPAFARIYIKEHGIDDVESMNYNQLRHYALWLCVWAYVEELAEMKAVDETIKGMVQS